MKLHRLRIENLNSLYGEHAIDFDRDLAGASLYLIAGPTGAGKSTILDAVSLALFGQTPRLRGTWSDEDENGTINIMSRGTGTCVADLEFSLFDSTRTRRRYRATWKMRRANEKPDGNPKQPVRALYELVPSAEPHTLVNDHRSSHTDPVFAEALCGLSVDDFLKRIVLAQGDFAGFVRSDVGHRRDILAKLVPTERYKRLGERVGRITSTKRGELKRLSTLLERDQQSEETTPKTRLEQIEAERKTAAKRHQTTVAEEKAAKTRLDWLVDRDERRAGVRVARKQLGEATSAWEQLAEDRASYEQHRATQPFAVGLSQRAQHTAQQTKIKERLDSSSVKQKTLSTQHEEAEKAQLSLKNALDSAEQQRSGALPQLKKAQEAWVAVRTRKQELDQHRKLLATAAKTQQDAEKSQKAAQTSLEESRKSLASSQTSLAELPYKRTLLARRTEIEDETWAWQKADTEHANAAKANERQQADVKSAEELATSAAKLCDSAKQLLAEKTQTLATAESAHQETLKSFEVSSAEQLEARRAAADKQLDAFVSLEKQRDEVRKRAEDKTKFDELVTKALKARDESAQRAENARKAVEDQQNKSAARRQILAGENARAELTVEFETGEPCPLCGSEDHVHSPQEVRDGIQKRVAEAERQLDASEAELKAASERLESLAAALKDAENALTSSQANAKNAAAEHERSLDAFTRLQRDTGLELPYDAADAAWTEQQAQCAAAQTALVTASATLKQHAEALQAAKHALELAAKDGNQASTRLEEAAKQVKAEEQQLALSQKELATAAQSLADTRDAVVTSLDAGGWQLNANAPNQTVQSLAQAVREKLKQGADLQNAIERDEARLEERSKAVTSATKSLEAANKTLTEQTAAVTAAEQALKVAESARDEFFEGKDPEDVRASLDKSVSQARDVLEASHKEFSKLATAITENATTVTELKEQLADTTKRLREVDESLAELLVGSVFESLLDVTAARLSEEDADRLKHAIKKCTEALKSAKMSAANQQKALEEHLAKKPQQMLDDEDEPADYADELRAQCAELAAQLTTISETIGQLNQEEASIKKQLEEQEELLRAHDKAREDLDVWNELNGLLGVSNGDHFVTWVLALTFEQLLQNANKHLQSLNPRYQLRQRREDTGERILDFHVVDLEAAGATRPTSTLSGGETFLVSLALALGLSGLDSVDFKSETLLLDEGFGTLDKESLDDALRTLEELHATNNVQVGLISHVESLQTGDRIPAQIRVEPRGDGRSTLRVVT